MLASCFFCRSSQENLCDAPLFTGYQINGGYADYTVAEAAYCFPLPESYADAAAAPLLCAGLIGHRAAARLTPSRMVAALPAAAFS